MRIALDAPVSGTSLHNAPGGKVPSSRASEQPLPEDSALAGQTPGVGSVDAFWAMFKYATPINGWFIYGKSKKNWMIWGYPHFRKPPYVYCS